ncbi:collagenase isoform X2 [Amyelois transitella]|uniref:collagenase isoform X2 n=1 Tax=Amyelois transitella TaxID=680683 RepID=UPI00299076D7|nr:collagenase isoform X2 [Amyelois transitella]
MKLLIIIFALAAAVKTDETLYFKNYHDDIGVPLAAKIKTREESIDFDGSRITGGNGVTLGTHPHFGGLVISLMDGRTSVCGSTLLSNTRAVTAAHCWWHGNVWANQFVVVYASTQLFSGGLRIRTSSVVVHANFNHNNLNNDVAVISFGWISYTNWIEPAFLPINHGYHTFVGTWAWAVGFGATGDNDTINNSQSLNEASLQVIDSSECARIYGTSVVTNSVLCVSGQGRSICNGDDGGPLWIWHINQRLLFG